MAAKSPRFGQEASCREALLYFLVFRFLVALRQRTLSLGSLIHDSRRTSNLVYINGLVRQNFAIQMIYSETPLASQ